MLSILISVGQENVAKGVDCIYTFLLDMHTITESLQGSATLTQTKKVCARGFCPSYMATL